MNPANLFKVKKAWETFAGNHPKFLPFLQACNGRISEGSIIAVEVIDPNGEKITTNLKVTASDMELFDSLKEM